MKKTMLFLVLICILMISTGLFAQAPLLPIDFDDPADDAFVGDGGAVYSLETALFTPDVVGEIVGGTDQWNSRVDLDLGTYIDMTTTNKTFTFDFYTTEDVVMTGLLQISDEASSGYAIEMQFTTNGAIGWETISLDFNGAANAFPNAGEPVVYGNYAQISIFTNFGDTGTSTYYFDDLAGAANGAVVPVIVEPSTDPPVPSHAEEDVIAIYTEVYTDLTGTDFNPPWGQSTSVTHDYQVGGTGNYMLKYETLNYQGTQYTNQDVSAFEYLHVDYWTPNSTSLDFYLISPGNETFYSLPITLETWGSVDIDLTDFVPPVVLSDVFQFKVVGNGTVYFDNWYFWKNPTGVFEDATLSDLLIDGTTVDGFNSLMFTYDVELPIGTTIVPTVTAVTNYPFATYIIIDAASLPGTTEVLVTAVDGVTTQSYYVNFTVATPEPAIAAPTPTQDPGDVISVYSDAYTNITPVNYNPFWGQSTVVTVDYPVGGNNTLMYEDLNFQGTDWSSIPQNVLGMDYLHIDFWTANSTDLGIYLIGSGETEHVLTITPETWVSTDIPLSNFVPPVDLSAVIQFKVEGNGDVWIDNLYFWDENIPGTDATLSDLQVDGETVDGFSAYTLSYDVELPFGTTVVPTVTATTNDPAAAHVVNDAASLPGTTTVVVTALDGITTETYSINFTVASVPPGVSEYCETEVWHFNNPAEVPSAIYLTITNLDVLSMFVEIESADADPVDLLIVTGGSGATISGEDLSIPGRISRTLTWDSNPPDDVVMNILWSKVSFGGNWMLSQGDITVPFDASCDTESETRLSDLLVDGETVDGFAASILTYDVELPNGTTVVPTVTATTYDPLATHGVNDATSLPGTTEVVVTAQDGITTQTYSINFTVAEPSAYPTHTVDFEPAEVGEDWAWTVGENADNPPLEFVANPDPSGINTSASVAKFTARLAGNPWALCLTSDDGEFTFDVENSIVKIMVYKPAATDVGFKVEGASGAHEIVVPNTLINQWEELTFDFSGQIGNTYGTMVIIPDFDFTPRPVERIVYFDNIQVPDGVTSSPLDAPTNVEITKTAFVTTLTWNTVTGANSYKVYSNTDPYADPGTWTLEEEGISGTIWGDTSAAGTKKFYYVVASTDVP